MKKLKSEVMIIISWLVSSTIFHAQITTIIFKVLAITHLNEKNK